MQAPGSADSQDEENLLVNAPKWSPLLPVLSGASLRDVLNQATPTVVHFFGLWNEYDGIVQKRLSALEPQYRGVLSFTACDICDESNFAICSKLGIITVPTVLGVQSGTAISRLEGTMSKQVYDRFCGRLVSRSP